MSPVADPFASIAPPVIGSCVKKNFNVNKSTTIDPGTYCDGINVTGGTLTLNPGTYILNGGGLTLSSTAAIVGNGVTIYNTSSGGYNYAPINLKGGSQIRLTAPASGPFEGMLFFTDRNITNTSANVITGNSTSNLTGALYFPSTPLSFTGNSSVTAYTIFVVRTLHLTGSASVNNDYTGLSHGSPVKIAALIE